MRMVPLEMEPPISDNSKDKISSPWLCWNLLSQSFRNQTLGGTQLHFTSQADRRPLSATIRQKELWSVLGERGRDESRATLRCEGPALPTLAAQSATVAKGFLEVKVPSSAEMESPMSARDNSDLSHWIRCSKASTGPRPSKLFSREPQNVGPVNSEPFDCSDIWRVVQESTRIFRSKKM